jgi:hypothetical protein
MRRASGIGCAPSFFRIGTPPALTTINPKKSSWKLAATNARSAEMEKTAEILLFVNSFFLCVLCGYSVFTRFVRG